MAGPAVREALRDLFERYGLPDGVRVDNGGPWGRPQNVPSWLALWLAGLGVAVHWIRPGCPRDNPQVERSNGLIEPWSEPQQCASLADWQAALNRLVTRQRDEYPIQAGQTRTQLYPDFYQPRRAYCRQAEVWDLTQAQRLLAQFTWQRLVSQTGQLTVMHQRFAVGRTWAHAKVVVQYEPTDNTYVVRALTGEVIVRQPARDINAATIQALAGPERLRQRSLGQTCDA